MKETKSERNADILCECKEGIHR